MKETWSPHRTPAFVVVPRPGEFPELADAARSGPLKPKQRTVAPGPGDLDPRAFWRLSAAACDPPNELDGAIMESKQSELSNSTTALEGRSPLEVLLWAVDQFPRITFATGFGVEGCVLIDLIGRHALPIDVFTLDTGLLFPETYELWHRLEERYRIGIRAVRPDLTVEEQQARHGAGLWEIDPDRCCELRKVIPLRRALSGFDAWITAIRRDQTLERAQAQLVERDRRFALVKVNPLVGWTSKDVWAHVRAHRVPYNALHDRGYASIGCAPCTSPTLPGEDPRAGRWRGRSKIECGLHADVKRDSDPINVLDRTKG